MTAQKLRDAAARIREIAAEAGRTYPGQWAVRPSGNGHYVHAPDRPGASMIAHTTWDAAANQMALWSPPVALAVADWLEDAAGEADMVARIMVPAGTVHDGDSQPWVPRLLPGALAVADLILGGAR